MFAESFMKIEADEHAPKGPSTDAAHSNEMELLSFEYSLERSPTRGEAELAFKALTEAQETYKRVDFSAVKSEDIRLNTKGFREGAEGFTKLASELKLPPICVLKVVDSSSPLLSLWATKRSFLKAVTLTLVSNGEDLLKIELEEAFICDIEVVGSYAAQPWLNGLSPAIWNSTPQLHLGPLELLRIAYQKITWSAREAKGTKVCGWDSNKKKPYTKPASS